MIANSLEQEIKVNGVKNGLLLGLILTTLSILSFYFITTTKSATLFVAAPIIFSLFVPVFFVVIFCFNMRKKIGGYWTFKQATTGIFVMFITAYLIQFIGKDLIFDRVIRPDNVQMTQNAAINAKATLMKQRGDNQKLIDKSTADLKKDFSQQNNVTIGGIIQGMIFSVLFIFVFALIFGSLFKKDGPVYATPLDEEGD
jgi:Protein of unknown function (DUF4199)